MYIKMPSMRRGINTQLQSTQLHCYTATLLHCYTLHSTQYTVHTPQYTLHTVHYVPGKSRVVHARKDDTARNSRAHQRRGLGVSRGT